MSQGSRYTSRDTAHVLLLWWWEFAFIIILYLYRFNQFLFIFIIFQITQKQIKTCMSMKDHILSSHPSSPSLLYRSQGNIVIVFTEVFQGLQCMVLNFYLFGLERHRVMRKKLSFLKQPVFYKFLWHKDIESLDARVYKGLPSMRLSVPTLSHL